MPKLPFISDLEKQKIQQYIQKPRAQEITEAIQAQQASLADNEAFNQMAGKGRFRDTGRQSEGIGESVDSVVGSPVRRALLEAVQGNFNTDAAKRIVQSIGADPANQPTGVDVASEVTDNPLLGTILATGVDMVGAPMGTKLPIGVQGSVKAMRKAEQARLAQSARNKIALGQKEGLMLAPGMSKDSQFGIMQLQRNKQIEMDAVNAAKEAKRVNDLNAASSLDPAGHIKPSDVLD